MAALKQRRAPTDRLADRLANHERAGLATAPIERFRHGQELAAAAMTRAPHQIANGVQTLLHAGRVSAAEVASADRFYEDYAFGILGGHDPDRTRGSSAADFHLLQLARCRAITAHHAIAGILGMELTAHLVAFVVDDLTMAAMARRFPCSGAGTDGRKAMGTQMATLLLVLTGLYACLDRRRTGGTRDRRDQLRVAAAAEFD